MVLLMIGTTELLLIGGIALLLFGGKKLPEMMRGMGQGVRSFNDALNEPAPHQNEENSRSNQDEESTADQVNERHD